MKPSKQYAAKQEINITEKHTLQDSRLGMFIYSIFHFMAALNYKSLLEV